MLSFMSKIMRHLILSIFYGLGWIVETLTNLIASILAWIYATISSTLEILRNLYSSCMTIWSYLNWGSIPVEERSLLSTFLIFVPTFYSMFRKIKNPYAMYTMLNNAMAYMVMSIVKDIENWKEIAINSIGIAKFVLDTYLGSDHFLSKLCVFLYKSIEEFGGKLHYSIPTINGVLSRCCADLIGFVYSKEQNPLIMDGNLIHTKVTEEVVEKSWVSLTVAKLFTEDTEDTEEGWSVVNWINEVVDEKETSVMSLIDKLFY